MRTKTSIGFVVCALLLASVPASSALEIHFFGRRPVYYATAPANGTGTSLGASPTGVNGAQIVQATRRLYSFLQPSVNSFLTNGTISLPSLPQQAATPDMSAVSAKLDTVNTNLTAINATLNTQLSSMNATLKQIATAVKAQPSGQSTADGDTLTPPPPPGTVSPEHLWLFLVVEDSSKLTPDEATIKTQMSAFMLGNKSHFKLIAKNTQNPKELPFIALAKQVPGFFLYDDQSMQITDPGDLSAGVDGLKSVVKKRSAAQ